MTELWQNMALSTDCCPPLLAGSLFLLLVDVCLLRRRAPMRRGGHLLLQTPIYILEIDDCGASPPRHSRRRIRQGTRRKIDFRQAARKLAQAGGGPHHGMVTVTMQMHAREDDHTVTMAFRQT